MFNRLGDSSLNSFRDDNFFQFAATFCIFTLTSQKQIAAILGRTSQRANRSAPHLNVLSLHEDTRSKHIIFPTQQDRSQFSGAQLPTTRFPLSVEKVEHYGTKRLLISIIWAFSGDAKLDLRVELRHFLSQKAGIDLPALLGPR